MRFYDSTDDIEREELAREAAAQRRGDLRGTHRALHPEQYDEPPDHDEEESNG